MLFPKGQLLRPTDPGPPVFEDLSGLRRRRYVISLRVGVVICLVWALVVTLVVLIASTASQKGFDASDPLQGSDRITSDGRPMGLSDASILIRANTPQSSADVDLARRLEASNTAQCRVEKVGPGAANAADKSFGKVIYAFLPTSPDNAFLSLLRNCARVNFILAEWYEISGSSLEVRRHELDQEMLDALGQITARRGSETAFWPVFTLASDLTAESFLKEIQKVANHEALSENILATSAADGNAGFCLRMPGVEGKDARRLYPFLKDLSARAKIERLKPCLIVGAEDTLWSDREVVASFDKVVVTAFRDPWLGSIPEPLADIDWLRKQVAALQASIDVQKLVIALGGHAVAWRSGEAVPKRLSLAEAMAVISESGASIDFSTSAMNSYAEFFDSNGRRQQIWMLDAATTHNAAQVLNQMGVRHVGLASLGYEEPATWDVLVGEHHPAQLTSVRQPTFPDSLVYQGEGSFYRFKSMSRSGVRTWSVDEKTGFVTSQTYHEIPRAAELERFGSRNPKMIALTFDDGPNPRATSKILDVLKSHDALATFFVVGRASLNAPEIVRRAMEEGHTIGSHSLSHPHMEDLGWLNARVELSAAKSVVEGITGRTPRLYRPPYIRGPGPLDEHEALAFSIVEEEAHIVAGSDIVPPDWAGVGAQEIVAHVLAALEQRGGNVIVLHDGRDEGMHTAAAVDLLIPALRERGYEIVPIPVLLGLGNGDLMPPAEWKSSVFKGATVSTVSVGFAFIFTAFWVCLFATGLRSIFYFYLAARRDPAYPTSFAPSPSVTVVVPAYNEETVIVETVRSVLASDYPDLACLVIDDGSNDDTLRILKEYFGQDERITIVSQVNQGKWRALNTAFTMMNSEIAVCVDADTKIAPDAIREIVKPFTDSKVAAVAGTVTVANTNRLLTLFQALEYITAQQVGRRAQDLLNGIMVVPGALGAWRVSAVRDVGLYSNDTLTEDADLTIWMRRGGFTIAYSEHARAFTEAPEDVRSLLKQRLRWSLGNLQTLWKHQRAILEFSGRRVLSMVDMVVFGYIIPLLAPFMDMVFLFFVASVFSQWKAGELGDGIEVSHIALIAMLIVQGLDLLVALVAVRRDGTASMWLVLIVPLMNLLYRPLLYVTTYRALWAALTGSLPGWNKLKRLGVSAEGRTSQE